jgi:hypothetical protein
MTLINRTVNRETFGTVHSAGKRGAVIVSILPPNVLGFRLKGTRRTYYLSSEGCFLAAVRAQLIKDKADKAKARKANRAGCG